MHVSRGFPAVTIAIVLAGCAPADEEPLVDDGHVPGDVVQIPEGVDLADDAIPLPPEAQMDSAEVLPGGASQLVYVNFDGPTIHDCSSCSSAPNNESFIIHSHFGKSKVDFAAYGNASQRNHILGVLRGAFAPYRIAFTTMRPASGPYQMLVIGGASGPAGGVAPLDCDNTSYNDIAFVYATDGSLGWVARAAVHELGHSFGLHHVTSGSDFMHYQAAGSSFTKAPLDFGHGATNACVSGNDQNAPAELENALLALPVPCAEVDRRAGANRFATAAAVSKSLYPSGASAAVIVLGSDTSVDALTAGPFARSKNAPLLLTTAADLPAETANELSRLGASKAYIVGGKAVVGQAVEDDLSAMGLTVQRIAGANRYATAAAIAKAMGSATGLAFIASGDDAHLVDALAASGPAAGLGAPVLLVTHGSVPAETSQALSDLSITHTIVAGGKASVSDAVVSQLPSAVRASGATRFDTAAALAKAAVAEGLDPSHAFVSRADKMPDALAAGAGGDLLLISDSAILSDQALLFLYDHSQSATLLGGGAALGQQVERHACASLQ